MTEKSELFAPKVGKSEYGKITEEALEKLRSRIGVERVTAREDWEIDDMRFTRAHIRRLAFAFGDYNPLYLDMEYAKKSPYGNIIALPGVLQSNEQINAARDGMPGMHALFRGLTMEWKQPMFMGEVLLGKTYLRDVKVIESKLSRQSVIQDYESIGLNEQGEIKGILRTSWSRHERTAAKGSTSKKNVRSLGNYTPEEYENIKQHYRQQVRRGAEPRYWEDVEVGEELPKVVKGPTNPSQRMVGEGSGGAMAPVRIGSSGDWGVAHAQFWKLFERHPGLPIITEQGIPEQPFVIHNSNERAQRYLGLAGGYEAGAQRVHWTVQIVTDWQGDHGFLRKMTIKFPAFFLMGDCAWCGGKVSGKRVEDNKHIVELDLWNINQLDIVGTEASAEVVLPSRSNPNAKMWE